MWCDRFSCRININASFHFSSKTSLNSSTYVSSVSSNFTFGGSWISKTPTCFSFNTIRSDFSTCYTFHSNTSLSTSWNFDAFIAKFLFSWSLYTNFCTCLYFTFNITIFVYGTCCLSLRFSIYLDTSLCSSLFIWVLSFCLTSYLSCSLSFNSIFSILNRCICFTIDTSITLNLNTCFLIVESYLSICTTLNTSLSFTCSIQLTVGTRISLILRLICVVYFHITNFSRILRTNFPACTRFCLGYFCIPDLLYYLGILWVWFGLSLLGRRSFLSLRCGWWRTSARSWSFLPLRCWWWRASTGRWSSCGSCCWSCGSPWRWWTSWWGSCGSSCVSSCWSSRLSFWLCYLLFWLMMGCLLRRRSWFKVL